MTPEEAAARLGVALNQVADVAEHADGHIVRTVDQALWLVTPALVRRYVPDADGEPAAQVAAQEDEVRTTEPAPKPARRRKSAS